MLSTKRKVFIATIFLSSPLLILAPVFYQDLLWQRCCIGWMGAICTALIVLFGVPIWREKSQFWQDRAMAIHSLYILEHLRLPYFDQPLRLAKPLSRHGQLLLQIAVDNVRRTIPPLHQLINGSVKERGLKISQIPTLVERLVKELDAVLAHVTEGVGEKLPALANFDWFEKSDILGQAISLFPALHSPPAADVQVPNDPGEMPYDSAQISYSGLMNVIPVDFRPGCRKRIA